MRKALLLLLILLLSVFSLYSEKWVGRIATYQLLDGSKTASGDFFNRDILAAACNGFKFGSKVFVTNAKTGKKVEVVINDRIDKNSDYFIFLTPGAARELDLEWETGIAVVDAMFSDVNSSERLAVNGLVREGEIDVESIKEFPEIIWPKIEDDVIEKQKDDVLPELEKKEEAPIKKEEKSVMDLDEKDQVKFVERDNGVPEEDALRAPARVEGDNKMDKDGGGFFAQETSKDVPSIDRQHAPEKVVFETFMDTDKDDVDVPVVDKDDTVKPDIKDDIMDKDKNDVVIEAPTVIEWAGNLERNKIYVRFSTTANKSEGERRYLLFEKVFPGVVGVKRKNKYILYVGPVEESEIDSVIKKVRGYGFKDAYIIKE